MIRGVLRTDRVVGELSTWLFEIEGTTPYDPETARVFVRVIDSVRTNLHATLSSVPIKSGAAQMLKRLLPSCRNSLVNSRTCGAARSSPLKSSATRKKPDDFRRFRQR